ncbi:hypothetical protein ZOSMA_14G01020 [Zostera marina]|nr:hypothetical protein ZOSMA_14G01020 [Zostera marina]
MMEWVVVVVCGLSCVLQSFTDSYKDEEGVVQYGVASRNGMWFFQRDIGDVLPTEKVEEYRIKVIDFVHAFMSLLVFVAVVLFDKNVVNCLLPGRNGKEKEVLVMAPFGIGFVCSVLFIVFPTTRHGVGFPVAPH